LSIIQNALNKNWLQEKSGYRRLYALGIDAYNLIPKINRLNHEDSFMIEGETGDLTIVRGNIIKRNLRKAKFIEGKPVLLN
jgi:outer membrane PBP1 activator LpoA protein